jgi:hypothetical protein
MMAIQNQPELFVTLDCLFGVNPVQSGKATGMTQQQCGPKDPVMYQQTQQLEHKVTRQWNVN